MNEHSEDQQQDERDEAAGATGSQSDVIFLLKRLQEQLTFLERKVDLLISQSKEKDRERPSYDKERSYSKPPFRPYSSERRPEGRYEGNRSEARPAYGHKPAGRPSYGSKPYGQAGFAGKKKPYVSKNRER